jgi:sugar phosphate isomerase/epimerase
MIRSPLGLHVELDPDRSIRDQIRQAAQLGARGVVLDATGELSPDRLSETGRRDLRHLLRTTELTLVAIHLPTRRPFDSFQDLDARLARAERAFALSYDLGARLVIARLGALPPEADAARREAYVHALRELGRRADHRGIRLAIATGTETGADLRSVLDSLALPGLAASLDPTSIARGGRDPIRSTEDLGPWVAHAVAPDPGVVALRGLSSRSRGISTPPAPVDWAEYLGALEEIEYRGFLTVWPSPEADPAAQFTAVADLLKRY